MIIRPEMVTIRKSGGLFKGIIRRAVYLGDVIEYDVEVAGMLLTGTETDPNRQEIFPEGSTVTVDLAAGCIQALHA